MCNNVGEREECIEEILIVNEIPMSPKIRNPKIHELNNLKKTLILCCLLSLFPSALVTDSA